MNKQIASLALQFLGRVQLQGNEAPALMQVVAALEAVMQAPDAKESKTPTAPAK